MSKNCRKRSEGAFVPSVLDLLVDFLCLTPDNYACLPRAAFETLSLAILFAGIQGDAHENMRFISL